MGGEEFWRPSPALLLLFSPMDFSRTRPETSTPGAIFQRHDLGQAPLPLLAVSFLWAELASMTEEGEMTIMDVGMSGLWSAINTY